MSITPNYSTQSPTHVKSIGSRTYRYGSCHTGYFLREVETGARLQFYSAASLSWFLRRLEEAAASPMDANECVSCHELFHGDSEMCPDCENNLDPTPAAVAA